MTKALCIADIRPQMSKDCKSIKIKTKHNYLKNKKNMELQHPSGFPISSKIRKDLVYRHANRFTSPYLGTPLL